MTAETTCEFCGGNLIANDEDGSVAHSLPICREFYEMDALEFLTKNRQMKEAKAGMGRN